MFVLNFAEMVFDCIKDTIATGNIETLNWNEANFTKQQPINKLNDVDTTIREADLKTWKSLTFFGITSKEEFEKMVTEIQEKIENSPIRLNSREYTELIDSLSVMPTLIMQNIESTCHIMATSDRGYKESKNDVNEVVEALNTQMRRAISRSVKLDKNGNIINIDALLDSSSMNGNAKHILYSLQKDACMEALFEIDQSGDMDRVKLGKIADMLKNIQDVICLHVMFDNAFKKMGLPDMHISLLNKIVRSVIGDHFIKKITKRPVS